MIQRFVDSGKEFGELEGALKGTSALLFSANFKSPAQAILKFRKKGTKPALKGAYVDSAVFIGDDQLIALSNLKSKEDLIGEIMGLLQSPAKNVVSALQSGGQTLVGVLKTLSEKIKNNVAMTMSLNKGYLRKNGNPANWVREPVDHTGFYRLMLMGH